LKTGHKIAIAALLCAGALSASENIASYSSPVTVNAFFRWGDTLWAASSGGLVVHDLGSNRREIISNSRIFPDLNLTALCRDAQGNLWIGSRKGYLYRRTPRGQFTVYSNYKISDWGILCLYGYDDLVVVGSNRGVSLFDPVKGVAVRNATSIGNFANPRVNTIEAFGDALFLGCDEGMAYLDSLDVVPLAQRNLYDPGIWKTRPGPEGRRVVSIVNDGDSVKPYSTPAAVFPDFRFSFRDVVFEVADSGWIKWMYSTRRDSIRIYSPGGGILKLYNEDDKRLWIGMEDLFYWSLNLESDTLEQYRFDGFTLRRASRVIAGEDGNMWFLPVVPYPNISWHHGIYRFDGRSWYRYNENAQPGQFGYIGDGSALGGAAGRGGTFWAGTSGANVKHIDPARNTVKQLIVGDRAFSNVGYLTNGDGEIVWGKVDALAVDTGGYLWVSIYDCNYGSLLCYDPRYLPVPSEPDPAKAHFRRFFTEPPFKTTNITGLSVDANNRIFAYDGSQDRLTVFRPAVNPLAGGIAIDTVYDRFGTVSAMEPGGDGAMYIAGMGGLRRFPAGSAKVEDVDSTINSTVTGMSGVAIQGNVFWIGTLTSGVLRYDLDKGEKRWIDEAAGLPSNNVLSIALDRKNGRLWAVTDEGVSQIDAGREVKAASGAQTRVFPNVFSVSGRTQGVRHVTFAGLEPRSAVAVYALNGVLVARINAEQFAGDEWRAFWTPKRTLAPGTYITVVRPSGKKAKIILKP
jgi:ligand-binding sensor domain-containing protein